MIKRIAKDYLKKPYSRVLIPEDDGTYSADILEFPGCFAEGRSPDEAYANLEKVAESWIEAALGQGQEIPEPIEAHDYSGRIALRIPKSIHKQAAKFAEMDDTSLNQFFLTAIAARVGAEDFVERLSQRIEANRVTLVTTFPAYTYNIDLSTSYTIDFTNVMTSQNSLCGTSEKPFISSQSGWVSNVIGSTNQLPTQKEVEHG